MHILLDIDIYTPGPVAVGDHSKGVKESSTTLEKGRKTGK